MGMAASQGRLLMLTARLHDVELRAQQLQNAKLQLSTQQDAAYEEYQRALDATTLTMASISGANQSSLVGTFNSIFSMGASRPANMATSNSGYILLDSRGRVVVEDRIADAYADYQTGHNHYGLTDAPYADNAYLFAWYMVEGGIDGQNLSPSSDLEAAINTVFNEHKDEMLTYYTNACEALYEEFGDLYNIDAGGAIITTPGTTNANGHPYQPTGWNNSNVTPEPDFTKLLMYIQSENGTATNDQRAVFNTLVNYFWSHYGQQVFNALDATAANAAGEPYNSSEFDYYVRIFNAIQQHGGCISINDFDGPDGAAANNSEWLTNMLQSGQLAIELGSVNNQGAYSSDGVSVSSDVNLSYTQTSQIDKVALAKAEAKYEHEMKTIDKKDQKFDLQLNKLETERTALTKQLDSIKKVSDDNVERTFGIFS